LILKFLRLYSGLCASFDFQNFAAKLGRKNKESMGGLKIKFQAFDLPAYLFKNPIVELLNRGVIELLN
jgi:hypothetical protein